MKMYLKVMIVMIMLINFMALSIFMFFQLFGEFMKTAWLSFDTGIIAINAIILFSMAFTAIILALKKSIEQFLNS